MAQEIEGGMVELLLLLLGKYVLVSYVVVFFLLVVAFCYVQRDSRNYPPGGRLNGTEMIWMTVAGVVVWVFSPLVLALLISCVIYGYWPWRNNISTSRLWPVF